jgi:uncharacterized membrane protein
MVKPLKSTKKRYIVKAVCWETFSTLLTMGIAYPFTGSIGSSASLALACLVVKMIFYYHHERTWQRSTWGKIPIED